MKVPFGTSDAVAAFVCQLRAWTLIEALNGNEVVAPLGVTVTVTVPLVTTVPDHVRLVVLEVLDTVLLFVSLKVQLDAAVDEGDTVQVAEPPRVTEPVHEREAVVPGLLLPTPSS